MTNIPAFLLSLKRFVKQYLSLGTVLLLMVVIAMLWANSPWHHSYHALWETEIAIVIGDFKINEDLHHWINDFLMAYFFFMVGLEIKRGVTTGYDPAFILEEDELSVFRGESYVKPLLKGKEIKKYQTTVKEIVIEDNLIKYIAKIKF